MKRFIAEADRAQITLLPESLDDYIDEANRLFMAASQSLYAVYVNTQGAAPG